MCAAALWGHCAFKPLNSDCLWGVPLSKHIIRTVSCSLYGRKWTDLTCVIWLMFTQWTLLGYFSAFRLHATDNHVAKLRIEARNDRIPRLVDCWKSSQRST